MWLANNLLILTCVLNREDLVQQLNHRSSDIEVKLLLFAIQKTADFERLLAQRFSNPEVVCWNN